MRKVYTGLFALSIYLLVGCASYQTQYATGDPVKDPLPEDAQVEQVFYLLGDAGNAGTGGSNSVMDAFKDWVTPLDTQNDYLIYLGDNIYEQGMGGDPNSAIRKDAEGRLKAQTDAKEYFDGSILFIPGNHDWYSGIDGVKDQQKFVEKELGKNTFQPEDGCPIEKIDISDQIVLLVIDTQWYLERWDDTPTMNDECEIKTRTEFIDELEGELKKNNEKTVVLAMHHPAYTYGPHNGGFSADKHLFPFQNKVPLPGLASLAVQMRATGGVSPQDRNNKRYEELMDRLTTIVQGSDRVIMVSGHEHSLQYIEDGQAKQIVSGSASKNSAVRLGTYSQFAHGGQGFAKLSVYKDGSSKVQFYGLDDTGDATELFETVVHEAPPGYDTSDLPTQFDATTTATVYPKSATDVGDSYGWFWGDHYRYVYGTDISVPVFTLDTLMGGMTIERRGGGHQTRSLRLTDPAGRNFALRGVKKSATRYLQSVLFTNTYIEKDFEHTITEDLVLDFYTASHPFASFAVAPMADAVGVYHTNPVLFYMPKHQALGKYNNDFGGELYVMEERPDDGFLDVASFGKPDAIESTSDMRKRLRKDEKYRVDEASFIRARLFDMVLGDWDRHQDQWRWSRFDRSKEEVIFRPIPRDRDQVFSNYDGAILDLLRLLAPPTHQLQTFTPEMKDIKWLNAAGIKLDRSFIQQADRAVWLEEARAIKDGLTDEVIDQAFLELPVEVQDSTANHIKQVLKQRRDVVVDLADRYYQYLSRLVIITGTDKDDHFEIIREDGQTTINVYRIKKEGLGAPYKTRVISSDDTREVWLYGLDDDDRFEAKGSGKKPVFIRIIGGQNNDVYALENGKNIKVHDHKSKPNTIEELGGASIRLADDYEVNTYDYQKLITRSNNIIPSIGANPDDGLRIGVTDVYTIRGFKTNPYHQRHSFGLQYYFATSGYDFKYQGDFANTFGNWNLVLDARFTSENFARNFFGFGNETEWDRDEDGLDFNRVRTGTISGRVGVMRNGEYGSKVAFSAGLGAISVEDTPDRFVSEFFADEPRIFDTTTFADVSVYYYFMNYDNDSNPARGMKVQFRGGVQSNVDDFERTFSYIQPQLTFFNPLSKDRKWVLKTMAEAQVNFGDSYEFYQAAVLGGRTGLRGYRTERFSGDAALALGGDVRYSFDKISTGLMPIQLGLYGGYDIGRVWLSGEDSSIWHDDIGGGIFLNAIDSVFGDLGVFFGDEGARVSFGFGVAF